MKGGEKMILLSISYILSVFFAYTAIRNMLIRNKFDADIICTIVTFIPILNVIWGIVVITDGLFENFPKLSIEKMLNKFYRLPQQKG